MRNAAALRRRAQQNHERVERERRADAAARELLGDVAPQARLRAAEPGIADSVPVWARIPRVVCCLMIVCILNFVDYDDVPFSFTTSKTFDNFVYAFIMVCIWFCVWKGIQAVSGFAAGESSWHCGVVADVCLPIVFAADWIFVCIFAFLGLCALLYEAYFMLRCPTTRQTEREDAPRAESSPAPRPEPESTTGGRPRRRRRPKPQTPTTRPAVAVAAPPTARAPTPPPPDAAGDARVVLVPGGRVALPALPQAPAPAPSKAAPKAFNRKARRAAAAAARESALASTGRTAADSEVAALLKRLGLERLETTFAREQIEAEALPLLTVDDLCGVGVPADDASRIVAAASASSASAAATSGGDHPESLCCPISMELMDCPVIAADGNTYDRSSIEDWFSRGKETSPLTGAPLAHLGLTPNNLVRSMVSEYRDASSRA